MIRRFFQLLVFLLAILILAGAVYYIRQALTANGDRPLPVKEAETQRPDVTVMSATAGVYQAKVTAYGTASPHYELSLAAQVSGRVQTLGQGFESGMRLGRGALLVGLETDDYRAAVAAAKQSLADARLTLLEEQRQALQAATEWKESGLDGEPESELVLRGPQVAAAQAAVTTAEAALASAENDLRRCRITAPFDALVVKRLVAPGGFVQAGGQVATLYSTDYAEITVSLSADEWNKLPGLGELDSGQWPVELADIQSDKRWTGRILRAELHLDQSTRQRNLILAVDQPLDQDPALLPGTFVQANIPGRRVEGLWKLPNAALSQRGEIWYVNGDDTLASFPAEPLFSDPDAIYIPVPESLTGEQLVLKHPLSSYVQGMAVSPVSTTGERLGTEPVTEPGPGGPPTPGTAGEADRG